MLAAAPPAKCLFMILLQEMKTHSYKQCFYYEYEKK